MSHHTTSPAVALAKAGTYDPEKVANLEATIADKIKQGEELAQQLFDTHRLRLGGRPTATTAESIRRQLELLQDDLAIELAILDRRRI